MKEFKISSFNFILLRNGKTMTVMKNFTQPINAIHSNNSFLVFKSDDQSVIESQARHTINSFEKTELFVKLPEENYQKELAIFWKDLQIVSIQLFEEKNKTCCYKRNFETAVSIHTIAGLRKGRYIAKLKLENGTVQIRILVLL